MWIEAGGETSTRVRTGNHDTTTLTASDAAAIKNQVSLIKSVSPNVDDPVQVVYGNQNWHTSYRGVSPEYFDIKRWIVDQGAVFSQDDVDRAAEVCVIGRSVRAQLFGLEDPVGQVIRVNHLPCKVVATLQPKGLSLSGQDQDDTILLPYTTAQKKLKGVNWLDDILCSAVSADAVKVAGQEAAAILRDRHHLRAEEDGFNIRPPRTSGRLNWIQQDLTILLLPSPRSRCSSAESDQNVMLVSVTERLADRRPRRRGATDQVIQLQFLGGRSCSASQAAPRACSSGIAGSCLVGRTLHWPLEVSPAACSSRACSPWPSACSSVPRPQGVSPGSDRSLEIQ